MFSSRRYTVLVVDNQAKVHLQAKEELRPFAMDLHLIHSTDLNSVVRICGASFIDLAFVDLQVGESDGRDVINEISMRCPHARIFVITKYIDRVSTTRYVTLLEPHSPVEGFIDKNNEGTWFVDVVADGLERFRGRQLGVSGIKGPGGVLEHVKAKRASIDMDLDQPRQGYVLSLRESDDAIESELIALCESVFGRMSSIFGDNKPRLALTVLRPGFTSSVICEAMPIYQIPGRDDVEGMHSILKIGPRFEIDIEYRR